jgi:Carboxypeptidase regulatory-like domain
MKRKIFLYTILGLTLLLLPLNLRAAELVTNGSFETGSFTGWTVATAGNGWYPWQVTAAGGGDGTTGGIQASSPIHGTRDAWTGFCCNTTTNPEYIQQDITIPTGFLVRMTWSDKIQSNLWEFCNSSNCGSNIWRVQILNTSNVLLQTLYQYTATYQTTNHNTGWVNHVANLSAYAGQTIRIRFSGTYSSSIGGNLNGPGRAEVDNVSIQTLIPTASSVTVGGRILTSEGTGISRVSVTLTNSAGATRTVSTNSFGTYNFTEVPAGETYTVTVNSKKYFFADSPRVVSVQDNIADLDFTASP